VARVRAELRYYEPVEASVGPVRFTALRLAKREEVEVGGASDIDRLYDELAKVVTGARKRGRNLVVEARVSLGDREVVYSDSSIEGAETLLYYRPARLRAVTVVEEGPGGSLLQRRYEVGGEVYVYEGRVRVRSDKIRFVIFETVEGRRLLRRGEFRVG